MFSPFMILPKRLDYLSKDFIKNERRRDFRGMPRFKILDFDIIMA